MKIFRTRERKRNHIEVTIEGGENSELTKEILAVLRKSRHRKKISYCITEVDFRQGAPRGHNRSTQNHPKIS